MCGDTISLDWHISIDLRTSGFGFQATRRNLSTPSHFSGASQALSGIKKHRTCIAGQNKYGYGGCITLEECLDSFSKEEKIPEAYCSKCQDFRVQTKQMS